MSIPTEWINTAKRYINNLQKTLNHFEELLKRHPEPSSLLSYLNERRFILLLMILEQSQCLRKFLLKHPTEFETTIPNLWYLVKEKEDYLRELEELTNSARDDYTFSEKLAYYRHKELLRIFAKELLSVAPYEDILREYSYLPDALLEVSFRRALEQTKSELGELYDEEGKPITFTVIGLGKLGSEELNYYSDIDIMFLHSSDKVKEGKVSVHQYTEKLFKRLLKLMGTQTSEGLPYKVDLDLRPFGKSGPISMSLRSAELYYESYGRVWEKFALLRARYSAGDRELAERFLKEVVEPFVFSGIDYKIVEEIRLMKKRIEAEAKKKFTKGFNVKTGEGGIREIEFSVQSLVILLGAKTPIVREKNTYRAIYKLYNRGVFSSQEAEFLEKAYTFLRKLEHRIQLKECIQTQLLKDTDKPLIAKYLGYENPEDFEKDLNYYASGVRKIFEQILPKEEESLDELQEAVLSEDRERGEKLLKEKGFKTPRQSFLLLADPLYGAKSRELSEEERREYLKLVPKVVELSAKTHSPDDTLKNFFKFFNNPTGSRVLLSKDKKEEFLEELFRVFSVSPYLSSLVSKNPDLVEDALTLYRDFPTREDFEKEFKKYRETLNLSPENLYRRFKTVWEVRIGLVYFLKEEERYSKLKKLFSALSELADFLLQNLWKDLELDKYRALSYSLGKLGSKELSFGSDLDLVFCVDSDENKEEVHEKVKELVRFITSHTSEGYLYSVDFRLRPMGTKGELVPAYDFYEKYFDKEARTWERLAWTRARYITGDKNLKEKFEKLIENFLFNKPWGEKEKKEVYEMRMKLQSVAKKGRGIIDLKLGEGGIVDGEFLTQYLLIKEKIRETSMIRGLEILKEKYKELEEAYESFMFLRLVETHLRLMKERGTSVLREQDIPAVANSLGMDEKEFKEELKEKMKKLREVFNSFLQ